MSRLTIINEIREHRDTRGLWQSMTDDQKRGFYDSLTGTEDHKTVLKMLKRICNKQRHDAAERRKHELNQRLQEIQAARPNDSCLADIRIKVLSILSDEPNPMLRARKLRQIIHQYDSRRQQLAVSV